jgi:hypothetical protein
MPDSVRDDFPELVKRTIAARAGHRCSNPACKAPTSGPQVDPTKVLNVGVAAHITAAAPGGPRYDASLAPGQRSGISNAIWLCQNCAKLVDNDPSGFPADLLHKWKQQAESDALTTIGKSPTGAPEAVSTLIEDKWVTTQYVERLGIPKELKSQGFRLAWAAANEEAELVDLEGWEYVVNEELDGRRVRYKIRDHPVIGGYLVLLKKRERG